ncbi:MAG: hypothetical protein LBM18_04880 [Oscillospiraceae bacterium]|jgi:hypothetical protein|nr:hypothetical protein [Oscillospiraceae bacterium]
MKKNKQNKNGNTVKSSQNSRSSSDYLDLLGSSASASEFTGIVPSINSSDEGSLDAFGVPLAGSVSDDTKSSSRAKRPKM